MPTTDPAPEWSWYDNTDLKVGDIRTNAHPFGLLDHEIEEWLEEIREQEARRIKPGFALPPEQAPKRRRSRKKS